MCLVESIGLDQEKCCREYGVPDVCFGYCETEMSEGYRSGVKTGICEKWFKIIRKCGEGRSIIIMMNDRSIYTL